jgi:hypothetical protein
MEGPKSWETKNPPKRKENKSSTSTPPIVRIRSGGEETLERMPSLIESLST